MQSPKKPLKMPPGYPRPRGQPCKNVLGKQIQSLNILSLPEKRVRMNNIATNVGDLEADGPKVV